MLAIGEGQVFVDAIIRPRVVHLVTLEFASPGEAEAFRALPWFGPEVTGDPRYCTQAIALRGLEEAPETPLSDPALDSLIDILDSRLPTQAWPAGNRQPAQPGPVTRAKAQTLGATVKVNLDAIEHAMMREMNKTLPNGKPM